MSNLVYAKFVDEAALVLPYTFAQHIESATPLEIVIAALTDFHVVSHLINKAILLNHKTTYVYVGEDEEDIGFIIYIAAATKEDCLNVWKILEPLFPKIEPDKGLVSFNFWTQKHGGAHRRSRQLVVPDWSDIYINYSRAARDVMEQIIKLTPEDLETNGRVIVLTGIPGSGKTYYIRALCRAWSSWCNLHYVVDPERFFGDAEYMLSTVMDDSSDYSVFNSKTDKLWNLMIMEDSGNFIVRDAKMMVGEQPLSKLLNLSSGLIGQGLNLIVLITTNEPLDRINEAVVREQRCLAEVEFAALSPAEVREWCAAHGISDVPRGEKTLAQLYALLSTTGGKIVSHVAKKSMQMGSF